MSPRVAGVIDGSKVQAVRQTGAVGRGPAQSEKIDKEQLLINFRNRFVYDENPPLHNVGKAYDTGKVVVELNERDNLVTVKLPLTLSNDIQKRAVKEFFKKDPRNEQVEKTSSFEIKFGYSNSSD